MSDIAHRHVTRGSECVCGSDWNWIADTCESIIPTPVFVPSTPEDEEWDSPYFECRKGHAFCGRH